MLEKLESLPRHEFTEDLRYYEQFDRRHVELLDFRGLDAEESIQHVYDLLRSRGASERCYVIGHSSDQDGLEADLLPVLREVVGSEDWTILSCIPGKLAYLEDERRHLILRR